MWLAAAAPHGAFGYSKAPLADDPQDPFSNDPYNYLNWGVVVGAQWRVDYANLASKYRRAQAQLAKQKSQYELLLQKIRLDVVSQAGEIERRQKELDIRKVALKAAKGWLISNTLNFGMGLATTDEILSSLIAYSQAKLTYFSIMYEYNLAVAKMSQYVGSELSVPRPTE